MRGLLIAGLVCWTFLAVSTIALAVSFIMRSWDKSPWRAPLLSILGLIAAMVLLSSGYMTTQIHAAEMSKESTTAEPTQPVEVSQPVIPVIPVTPAAIIPPQEQPAVEVGTVHINADGTVEIVQVN